MVIFWLHLQVMREPFKGVFELGNGVGALMGYKYEDLIKLK